MGKLIQVSLQQVPISERIKTARRLAYGQPDSAYFDLMLAALSPSDKTYLVPEPAFSRWTLKQSGSKR